MTEQEIFQHSEAICAHLNLAMRAARAAGKIISEGAMELATGGMIVEQKSVGDLVSQIDRDADQAACQVLSEASELPILSEELNSDSQEEDNLWIVDPLDASSAYLMQAGPQYPAVLVAMRKESETKVGVVFFPLTGDWFYARRGRGAWKNGKRLICDSGNELADVWVEMNQYGDHEFETSYFAELRERLRSRVGARLVTSNVPNSGVAMRIADGNGTLAAAIHDNNPSNVKQAAWDIAAPQVILEEAGGVFLNPAGQRTQPFVCEPIIVARSKPLALSIVELISKKPISG